MSNEWERAEKQKKLREQWEGVNSFVSLLIDKNTELEKQNETLKKQLEALYGDIPWNELKDVSEVTKELVEAKEIIKEYMRFEPMIGTCAFYSEEYEKTKKKAEQFLKEYE